MLSDNTQLPRSSVRLHDIRNRYDLLTKILMKSYKDRITHGPPPDNQVPGPVSNDKSHSTSALSDTTGQGPVDFGSINPHVSPQGSLNPWIRITRPLPGKGQVPQARVTRLWVTQPTCVPARVTQPTNCRDRVTRLWVTQSARC